MEVKDLPALFEDAILAKSRQIASASEGVVIEMTKKNELMRKYNLVESKRSQVDKKRNEDSYYEGEKSVDSDDRDKHKDREKGTKRDREETDEEQEKEKSSEEKKRKLEVMLEEQQVKRDEAVKKLWKIVEEWQELIRNKEESEKPKSGEEEDDEEFNVEKLPIVDHTKMKYKQIRGDFYKEVEEISSMTEEEVAAYLEEMDIYIFGRFCPKPIKAWNQVGLSTKILKTLKKMNFEKPTPIQAQMLPVIMSGRDCMGIAKTGFGKTLAFVLPMLRHITEQVIAGEDGLIALVIAPTIEFVQQIYCDISKFTEPLGLRCVAQKMSDLKRGAEIFVCTPGRMIDVLRTSGLDLRRVSYLVMDEMYRMLEMDFEPHITRIVQNLRPDKQIVLFSETSSLEVHTFASKMLFNHVEIHVNGKSVVNKDIAQLVEIRPENQRFHRLLELLGEWCEKGKILIFVKNHVSCDRLSRVLLQNGYYCLSLLEDKDRKSRIADFKTNNVCNILVATSFSASGILDVKDLKLVINYDEPLHYSDYVQRVGRIGSTKGCAITFVSEKNLGCSAELVTALTLSEKVIPDELKALADDFMEREAKILEQALASQRFQRSR